MAELDLIMQPYIDSGSYTEEELEKMRKLESNKLQQNTRETSWWKGEEGWVPDELQSGVDRPRVKEEKPTVVDEFLKTTNDQKEINKRKEHSVAASTLQPGDKEIPYRTDNGENYRKDGTTIKSSDVYDPERKEASSVLDYIKSEYDTGEEREKLVMPFGLSFAALMKVKNPWVRLAGATGFALGFDQIVPDSDEEEDVVEETDTYSNIPIVDFFDDIYNNVQQGWSRSEGVEAGLQVQNFTGDVGKLEEDILELYENDLIVASKGQTDEQRSYQKVYDNNKEKHGGIMAWMIGIKENPTFLLQTSSNSIANFAGSYLNNETVRDRAHLTGLTTLAGGQGVNKLLKKNKIGQLTSFLSGAYGATSMSMEQSYTFTDLLKEQLDKDGKEFTPENIKSLILDNETTTFKDPRFSTLDITGTRFEIMKRRALQRGVAIGFVDAVSGGITGQFIGPGNKIKALSLPGFAIPIAGGLASEVAGQTAGGQEYDAGEILTEGFAEKGGPMVALNTTREVVNRIKNPPLYKINREQFTKSQFEDYTSKMSDQEIDRANIEVENDQEILTKINESKQKAAIDNEIDSNITNVEDRKKLIDLEIQRDTLENNQKNKKGVRIVVGNKRKLAQVEEQIDSIISRYEGVKREDIKVQADAGRVKFGGEVKFQANMAFAKKHSSLYGLEYLEVDEAQALEQFGEDAQKSSGFQVNINGVETLVVNKDRAKEQHYGDNVGNHELLHGIIKVSGKEIKQSTIDNFLNLIGTDNAALIQNRLNENRDLYTDEYMAKNRDEYFTMFSDILAKNEQVNGKEGVGLNNDVLTKIKDWVRGVLSDLGFTNVEFETAEGALNFLKEYNRSIHKGTLGKSFIKATTKTGKATTTDTKTTGKVFSKSKDLTPEQRKNKIKELGREYSDPIKTDGKLVEFEVEHGNVWWNVHSEDVIEKIQNLGLLNGVISEKYKNYKENLDKIDVSKKEFVDTVYGELLPHIRNYKPEMQLDVDPNTRTGLNGWIMPQMSNKSLQAYEVLTKGRTQAPTVEIGQTTKEGDIKIQLEAEPDAFMEALETEDMSPLAVAKREAQKNKKKEQRYSKLRQDLGIQNEFTPEIIENSTSEQSVSVEEVVGPNTFTHKTNSIETVLAWVNGGSVIGVNKKKDGTQVSESLENFDSSVSESAFNLGGSNKATPNFQKGKIYGKNPTSGYVVVTNQSQDNFIPNKNFRNSKSFEATEGIGIPKPDANTRDINNFDVYKVNSDGSFSKVDISSSDLYNKIKDSARKSLIIAYKKTRGIKDKDARVTEVAKMIADEYAGEKGITSGKYTELFKLIKNSLGEKQQYIKNLKKNRESIVESIFTSDFVQIERKVTESEKVFTVFKKKLTSKKEVEDAVNKGLLPKDSLKTIDKGQPVNEYKKVMPNPNEFVGFFDQPLVTSEGKRSGLKGTRKDGLAKHLSKALIFDALVEVRQEQFDQELETLKKETQDLDPKAQQKLIEEFKAQLDVIELAAKISRNVDTKFSKSNTVTDINNAIDLGTNTSVYSEIRFSKSHRGQYENRLKKNRTDLTEEQRENAVQSVFDFVDGKNIPNNKKSKYEKMAMHYMANGHLILPEDGYKVIEAERLAAKNKIDPFSVKDPNALIQTYVGDSKAKRTDPDKVKTFSNKTEWSDGVVVYDIEDSKQGQEDVRKVADTHFGPKFQSWCLIHRSKEEVIPDTEIFDTREEAESMKMVFEETGRYETVKVISYYATIDGARVKEYTVEATQSKQRKFDDLGQAFRQWENYNEEGNGHKVAFHNGKLVAFRDGNQMQWWDINDKSFKAPVVRGKKGKDGFKPVSLAYRNKTEAIFSEKQVGDNKNGTYTKKRLDGVVVIRETKKDGKLHGEQMVIRENASSFYDTKTTTTHDANSDSRIYSKIIEERFYKDFRNKSGIDKMSFGIDDITLDNITKWKVEMSDTENTSVRTVEGTVNQKYFDFFKDPSAMKKEFPSYTLEQLTYAHSRYYGIQGKKVKVVITGQGNSSETISLTIDGVEQSFNPKFSSSKKIEVEHELTAREENILLPSYLNKEINRLKNTQDISTEESELLDILEEMRSLSGSGAVNVYNIMLNAFPHAFKNIVVADFSSEQSFVDAIKRNTQAQMKINAYTTSKRILEKQTRDLLPEQAVPKIVDYLVNLGRDVRSALIIPTNKGLKIDLIDKLQDGKFEDYFRAEPISKGSSKYKMQYKNSKGKFVDVEIYDSVKKIKENINKPGERARFNEQAERAQEYRLNLLDPKNKDHTLGDKLDNIELANTGTKGGGRKTAKVDVAITTDLDVLNKYSKIVAKLILEHEVTIKNMKAYERAYAKGNISREQMKSVYEQNKVHILPKGIDTVLQEAGKVSQRLGVGYESIPSAQEYLIDLHKKGIIDKLPDSLDTLFVRKSENFKDAVLFSKSSKKPTKGITILDFDDTLATSSSLIRFTRPNGTKGTLTPEQYASTYQDLLGLDYKFDFSEFNKVVDGKPAPLLNKAKKLAGKFGTDNMFILTARPKESAVAIQKFLKENGLDIPLKNITGLGNSTADAKALWVLDKAAEGYNDFYFADDAIQNVEAVQNMLDQIDVKSKVQQARVKFSKSDIKTLKESKVYKKFSNGLKGKKLYHGGNKIVDKIPGVKNEEYLTWFWNNDQQGAEMHIDAMSESENPIYANLPIYEVDFNSINESHVIFPDFEYIPYMVIKEAVDKVYPEGRAATKTKKKYADKREQKLRDKRLEESKTWKGSDYGAAEIMSDPKAMEILEYFLEWSFKNPELYEDYTGLPFYENGEISRGLPMIVLGAIPSNKRSVVDPKDYKMTPKVYTVSFSKSSLRNNKAVNNLLSQIDVKSKVQRDRVKFSASQDKYFNAILEDVSGVPSAKKFSQKVGEALGFGKGKFRFFVPPSHEDFVGLLYNFMGKGKKGNNHKNFFEKTLIRPLNRAYRKLNEHKQVIANNYKKLINHMPDIHNVLLAKIPNTAFNYQDAVRVYLWNKAGHEIPGLSKTEENTLVNIVKSYSDLRKFADMLGKISLVKKGYTTPGKNWLAGNIKLDLVDATGRVGRGNIFSEFIENADAIFSIENLNKIESIYGKNFREALEDVLYRTKTGTNRPTGSNKIINAWLDWVNASVGSTMFFNTRSALLQQLSFVNFMNFGDNNVFKAAARFADQKQYWTDWAMIFNSNYLKQRRSGAGFDVNASEIAREVSSSKEPFRAAVRYLLSIGFLPTQIGDSFAIAIGGSTFYRNRVNTYEKQGMSKKQAEGKAFLDFQEIAEETQQSARPDMISQQQASPLGRLALAFQNVTSQYARIVKKSTLDLVKRRISKGYVTQSQSDTANVSRIIYYGAIQSMIFYALQTALFSMMFGDDEEDEKLATKKERVINGTLDSLLKGTGVYGVVAATLKNYIWKFTKNQQSDAYFKTPAWEELLQVFPPIGIKIRKWKQFERTIDWNKDAIKEMSLFDIDNPIYEGGSQAVEGFTNLPIHRLYKKVQNIRAGMDSENAWWQRIASVLGWSKWDLGIKENDKIKEANAKGKKDKKDEKENIELQEQERKDGKTVLCAAVSRKGGRCKKEALGGGSYCTIHVNVEESESGEKKQCKGRKTTGGRCKMQTNSKSGYCYYHD